LEYGERAREPCLILVAFGGRGNKKAGEYSEEDTHRPAHHYREVVARRTVGQVTGQSAIVTLEKETP
jgi:hypothetical protein